MRGGGPRLGLSGADQAGHTLSLRLIVVIIATILIVVIIATLLIVVLLATLLIQIIIT